MKRVWILGASGSGKSTLAHELSAILGADCVDLDELNWRPSWMFAPPDEFLSFVERALREPSWIVAGNYTRTQAQFLHLADTIIWLDYPLPLVVWRQTTRTLRRVWKREPCCNGNYETFARTLSRDSALLWLLRTFNRRRRSGWSTKRWARWNNRQFLHFRRSWDCARWLRAIEFTRR